MSLSDRFAALDDVADYPITSALARWDGTFTQPAIDRLMEVMSRDFTTADRSDGSGRIRPSSIGNDCPRPALLSYHGATSDPFPRAARAIMDAGTWRHYHWQLMGLSAGFLDDIEVPIRHDPWRLRGSADGVGEKVGIFEFKSVNSQKLSGIRGSGGPIGYRPVRAHLRQVMAYMVARDLPWASLVYEDRNYLSWIEVRVERSDTEVAALDRLFAAWNAHIEARTMPPILPDCWSQSGSQFKYCNWKDACFNRG